MRKIYVTGLGVISGIGKGVEENLDSLKAGKHGMGKITLFPTALDVPVSEVKQSNEELKKLLSLPSGKTYSRTALLGLWAAQEAARDAELDFTSPRIGLISSTSIGGMDASERFYASFREDNRKGRLRDITLLTFVSLPRSISFSQAESAICVFSLVSLSVFPLRFIRFGLPVLGLIYLLWITHSNVPSSSCLMLPLPFCSFVSFFNAMQSSPILQLSHFQKHREKCDDCDN